MPKLPVVPGADVVQALQRAGFEVRRRRGSHAVLTDWQRTREVSVPVHAGRAVRKGTLRGIIRDAV